MYGLENKKHLGGYWNTKNLWGDPGTWGPEIWNKLIKDKNIKSVVDIGCGLGFSTKYFASKGLTAIGIEGGENALNNSVYDGDVRLHDYTTGSKLNDDELFDLVWCCEFVEHVEEEFADNFLSDFAHGNYVAMTHADVGQPGYHHVNCQSQEYWIKKLEEKGFEFDKEYSEELRSIADLCNKNSSFPHSGHLTRILVFKKK